MSGMLPKLSPLRPGVLLLSGTIEGVCGVSVRDEEGGCSRDEAE